MIMIDRKELHGYYSFFLTYVSRYGCSRRAGGTGLSNFIE